MTEPCGCCTDAQPCGCCEGVQPVTPLDETNLPGQSALAYRAGTWPTFFETMRARLSTPGLATVKLTTRESDDPAIALLDTWSIVGDVLTFYNERIANEAFLRTARERRSIVELGRLVGYRARPGVAASVYLAFTLQKGFDVTIPAGTAAKNTPGPGQSPQTFETGEDIEARSAWNEIAPRPSKPQDISNVASLTEIWFDGTSTRLKPNDKLLFVFGDDSGQQSLRSIAAVQEDFTNKRTQVTLQVQSFSASAFLQALDKIIPQMVSQCVALGTVLGKYLPPDGTSSTPASERLKALVDLDSDLAADIATLNTEGTQNQDSKNNLKTLAKVADEVHDSLNSFLSAPLDALTSRVTSTQKAWARQETHVSNVSDLLDTISFGATVALQTKALVQSEPLVGAEVEVTADFSALANAIAALRVDMRSRIVNLGGSLAAACAKLSADLLVAAGLPVGAVDLAVINTLKAVQPACATGAAGGTLDQKADAVETASQALHAASPSDPTLLAQVTSILAEADAALADTKTQLAAVTGSELHTSAAEQALIDNVHDAIQPLPAQLDGESLSQQQQDLSAALTTIATATGSAAALPVLHARLQELTAALAKAIGTDAKTGIDNRIAALPIPAFANDPEHSHSITLQNILTSVTGEPDVLKHIALAATAVTSLNTEEKAIQTAISGIADDKGCFRDAATALQPVLDRFRALWLSYMQALETLYARRLPPITEFGDFYPDARKTLLDLALMIRQIMITGPLNLKQLVALANALIASMTPTPTAIEKPWFDDLKKDLTDEILNATNPAVPSDNSESQLDAFGRLGDIAGKLGTVPTRSTIKPLTLKESFSAGSDTVARSLIALNPGLGTNLYDGWRSQQVGGTQADVYALRVHASLFGAAAPFPVVTKVTHGSPDVISTGPASSDLAPAESPNAVSLDVANDQILPDSWVVLTTQLTALPFFAKAASTSTVSLARYGIAGKSSAISLSSPWFSGELPDFSVVRSASVYALSEQLTLSQAPITDPIAHAEGDPSKLELDDYYDSITPGRSIVVTGERTDVPGVIQSEIAEIASVSQNINVNLPGDTIHTTLTLASNLQYSYQRNTVKINVNVAPATHGETQKEVLGSGNGAQSFQTFTLKHLPLTWLSEPTPSGAESTLQVRVNDILWHEVDNLAFLSSADRSFATSIDDDGTTNVEFGDGVHGLRLPTGTENVRGVYRSGIGSPGNVPAAQIGILPSPPLGVMAVSNPAPSTGGADPETSDQARRNIPIAVQALDRLVSVDDYAAFARTYAGIAKAGAIETSGVVQVVVAGIEDIPIATDSDLFNNLGASMKLFGDPHQPFVLSVRSLKLLAMSANIAIDPDYDTNIVLAAVAAALLDAFSFDNRDLGQPALLSEAIAAMQPVPGVLYVDVDEFGAISETFSPDDIVDAVAKITDAPSRILVKPNEIAYFSPNLTETLVLNAIAAEAGQ